MAINGQAAPDPPKHCGVLQTAHDDFCYDAWFLHQENMATQVH